MTAPQHFAPKSSPKRRTGTCPYLTIEFPLPLKFKLMYSRILLALASALWLSTAQADFEKSLTALQARDYATALAEARKAGNENDARGYLILGVLYQDGLGVEANAGEAFRWYEKAAKGGAAGAFSKLAWAYARGQGTPRNLEQALSYARLSAGINDPEGMYLTYLTITASSLRFMDANGQPDETKYKALAARPVADRALDTEARDWLYRSAQSGYPLAVLTLAGTLGGTLGDGNRKKMLDLVQKVPAHGIEALKNYEKTTREMEALGDSYATPQLFADAQMQQMTTAMLKGCSLNPTKAQRDDSAAPKLVSISIAKPLADAVYLPSKVAGFERAYLISGTWEEEWRYQACGNKVAFIVKFKADGLGGARNESLVTAKDMLGGQ